MNYSQEEIEILLDRIKKSNGVITPQNYFVQVPNSFVRNPRLSSDEKMMYIYLWGFGGESKYMYPGQSRMSNDLGWGKQKVIKILKSLEEKGGIFIIGRKHRNTNEKATNLYYLAEINTNTGDFIESTIDIIKTLYPDKFTYVD